MSHWTTRFLGEHNHSYRMQLITGSSNMRMLVSPVSLASSFCRVPHQVQPNNGHKPCSGYQELPVTAA
jgi:hypothetical protein